MLRNGNSRVAVAMSLGLVVGGGLALGDRARQAHTSDPPARVAVNLPDPVSELLPPTQNNRIVREGEFIARNNWNDMDSPAALS